MEHAPPGQLGQFRGSGEGQGHFHGPQALLSFRLIQDRGFQQAGKLPFPILGLLPLEEKTGLPSSTCQMSGQASGTIISAVSSCSNVARQTDSHPRTVSCRSSNSITVTNPFSCQVSICPILWELPADRPGSPFQIWKSFFSKPAKALGALTTTIFMGSPPSRA